MKSEAEIRGLMQSLEADIVRAEHEADKEGADNMAGAIGALRWVLELPRPDADAVELAAMLDTGAFYVGEFVDSEGFPKQFPQGEEIMPDGNGLGSNPVAENLIQGAADEARHEQGGSIQEGKSENPHKPEGPPPSYMGGDTEGGPGPQKDWASSR